MADEISLSDFRPVVGDVVARAQYAGEITVITKKGKPAAAVVPLSMLPDEVRAQVEQEGGDEGT